MAQAEAPAFIHSEAERAEMFARMQAIARRDEISAEEFEDVGWLILDRDTVEGEESDPKYGFTGEMGLPNFERPAIILGPAEKDDYFHITLPDGLNSSPYTGEMIMMDQDDKGSLRWRVGIINSTYSEFLGRRVELHAIDYVMAIEPLSLREHANLARRLVDNYVLGFVQA